MTGSTQRHLVIEVERVQTVRRRVPTVRGHCRDCRAAADLVELSDLAHLFEVSVADAVLQLRGRGIHMQHPSDGNIVVCTSSLLDRSGDDDPMLTKSLPPAADPNLSFSSE